MSNDIVISSSVLDNMSIKGRSYVEAAVKMTLGLQMIQEAEGETAQLDGLKSKKRKDGYGGTAGGRAVKLSASGKRSPSKIGPDEMRALLKKGPLTTLEVAALAGCSDSHVRNVFKADKRVTRIGTGNQINWTLRERSKKTVANKTLRRNFIEPETKFDDLLKVIKKSDGWASPNLLHTETGLSAQVVRRVLKAMKRAKLVESVEKTGNPAHSHSPKNFARTATYWVAT
jgi:hypothetical protein